ncbi:MAG: branched-chain amino acid ABC transporter permease [Candidatus Rokubacteria bacterium]|nr:branched-chain amino acid ABC transporter permease [Candidatus Rokubacteria bacterium]
MVAGLLTALQALVDGVMLGATYSLLGLGFTLVFGVLRRVNLAFGAIILVGIYAGSHWHLASGSRAGVLALTVTGAIAAGFYVERCALRPLAAQPAVSSMIATFAVWMQLQEAVSLLSVSRTLPYPGPAWLPTVEAGPLLLRADGLVMWSGAMAIMLALFALLRRTRLGRAMRAVADSAEGAALMGVNVRAVGTAAFVVASAVGGAAGALIAGSQQQVTPYFGLWATVKGLTAMLLGGAGSLPGAVLGGLVLGVAETETLALLGGQWRDLATSALLFLVVAWRSRVARVPVAGRPGVRSVAEETL